MKNPFDFEKSGKIILAYRDYQVEVNKTDPSSFGDDFDEKISKAVSNKSKSVLNEGVRSIVSTIKYVKGDPEYDVLVDFISSRAGVPREKLVK